MLLKTGSRFLIVIGNAVPRFNKDRFPVLEAYWEVDNSDFEGRLPFPKDKVPKYFSLNGFFRDVGLSDMFNFMETSAVYSTQHERKVAVGIRGIDSDYVSERLNNFNMFPDKHKKSNGCLFEWRHENNYQYNLKVLSWLENQMKIVVKIFDTPAIQIYE